MKDLNRTDDGMEQNDVQPDVTDRQYFEATSENVRAAGLDEVLKDRSLQSEFDRRIAKALETARGKWEQEAARRTREEHEHALEEAKQLLQRESDRREQDILRREQDIARRELRGTAMEQLARRGLPANLAELLNLDTPEAMEGSLNSLERAFRDAIRASVEQRMAGMYPDTGAAPVRPEDMDDDSYYRTQYRT